MMLFDRRFAVALAAVSALLAGSALAQDNKATTKSDKPAEAAPPPDSTTQGAVDVGGQHIVYTAMAGTITVGSTDEQDAQLGTDGKPQPGSQLAIDEPTRRRMRPGGAHVLCGVLQEGRQARGAPHHVFL